MHRFLGQLPQNLELKRSEAKSDHRRISAATAEESKDNFEISLEENRGLFFKAKKKSCPSETKAKRIQEVIERITTDIEERSEVFLKGLKPEREKKERKEEEKKQVANFYFSFLGRAKFEQMNIRLFFEAPPLKEKEQFSFRRIFFCK